MQFQIIYFRQKLKFLDIWDRDDLKINFTRERIVYKFTINKSDQLKICLAQTDPPGNAIQNNLNLILDKNVNIELKWISNDSQQYNFNDLDSHNNIRVIRLENVDSGTCNIHIIASNLLKQEQDFALVDYANLTYDQPDHFEKIETNSNTKK